MKNRSELTSTLKLVMLSMTLLWSIASLAQNELKAQAEYKQAENKIIANKMSEAVAHLDEAERLVGQWSVRISYLKITALNKLADSGQGTSQHNQKLREEVSKYLSYASKNENEIEPDNFTYVYSIGRVFEKERLEEEERRRVQVKQKIEEENRKIEAEKRKEKERQRDKERAIAERAKKEKARALTEKGRSFFEGNGVAQDYVQARTLLEEAAIQGDERAHYWIGILYAEGKGVQKDSRVAYNHFGRVPGDLKQYPDLPYYRALMAMENKDTFAYSDERDLVPEVTRAYHAGKQEAAAALGRFYLIGVDGKPDYSKSYEWYKKSGIDEELVASKITMNKMDDEQKIVFLSSPLSSFLPRDQAKSEINSMKNDLQKSVRKFRRKSVLNAGFTIVGIGCIYYGSELMKEAETENDDTKDGIGTGLLAGGIGMTLPAALSFALMDRKGHRIEKEKLKRIKSIPVLSVSPAAISYNSSHNYGLVLAVKF